VRKHTSDLRMWGRFTDSAAIGRQILPGSNPHGCSQALQHVFAQGPSRQCLPLSERHGMGEDYVGATAYADSFCAV
jgi:hypothetical protein